MTASTRLKRANRRAPNEAHARLPVYADHVCALRRPDWDRTDHLPVFPPKTRLWSVHPVLPKPVILRGIISTNDSPGRSDMSVGEQLQQRAAMGREKERVELAAFESYSLERSLPRRHSRVAWRPEF